MTRWLSLAAAVLVVAVGAFAAAAWVAGGDAEEPPPATTAPAPLARLRIIFPEGFAIAEMANRVAAVRQIAIAKRGVTPRLTRAGYLRAVDNARAPARFRKDMTRDSLEGFLFPVVPTSSRSGRQRARSSPTSCERSGSGFAASTSRTRARRTSPPTTS